MVLGPIYERAFLGFSYGFRPGGGTHDALNALAEAIRRKTSWVLQHRIGDRRMVRLPMKRLRAGIMEVFLLNRGNFPQQCQRRVAASWRASGMNRRTRTAKNSVFATPAAMRERKPWIGMKRAAMITME